MLKTVFKSYRVGAQNGLNLRVICILIVCTLAAQAQLPPNCVEALKGLAANPHREELKQYENLRTLHLEVKPEDYIESFRSETGVFGIERDTAGNAKSGIIRVLSDNDHNQISIIGEFNDWGKQMTPEDHLKREVGTRYFSGKIRELRHGMEYRFLVNGKELLDPAATFHTTPESIAKQKGSKAKAFLNSVFWDFDHPDSYKMKTHSVDLRGKYLDIAETEVYELARAWPNRDRKSRGPASKADTYRFIAESGVIDELKRMGYNAIEFLPFNSSVDGNEWKYRYQVFGLFGPDSRYGNPDEFKMMVDAFNRAEIAVIMDSVIGHYPQKANEGIRSLAPIGIHQWKKADGKNLFGENLSPWETFRYDYENPHVRQFLIDSILTNLKNYGISGIRFDNLDGIRFSKGGPEFLNELMTEIRRVRPETINIAEMFYGESAVTRSRDKNGVGMDLRTHSDLFDFFKDFLLKKSEDIDMTVLRDALRRPWAWNEITRVLYLTNHDEAANKRDGATGAYVASLIKGDESSWQYVEKKTKAFGSLARLAGTASLDMPQMRLLQEGSFYSNPGIDWSLRDSVSQRMVRDYFSTLSWAIKDKPAFAPQNLHPNIENHIDFKNKILSMVRIDYQTGKKFYALINLNHKGFDNYRFGVDASNGKSFQIRVDSDRREFAGGNELADSVPSSKFLAIDTGLHGKLHSIEIPRLAPLSVILLEQD